MWLVGYSGADGFEAANDRYYASQKRASLHPEPSELVEQVEVLCEPRRFLVGDNVTWSGTTCWPRTGRLMRAWILVGYPGQGGASAPHRVSPWSSRTPFTYTERGVNPRNWSAWSNSSGAVCRVKENRYLTQPPVKR